MECFYVLPINKIIMFQVALPSGELVIKPVPVEGLLLGLSLELASSVMGANSCESSQEDPSSRNKR